MCRTSIKPRAEGLHRAADISGGGVAEDAPPDDQMWGYADVLGWVARTDDVQGV